MTEPLQLIPIQEFKKYLVGKIGHLDTEDELEKGFLQPDVISSIVQDPLYKLQWEPIPRWENYQKCCTDLDKFDAYLYELLFRDQTLENETLWLVTDWLADRGFIKCSGLNLAHVIWEEYPEQFDAEFFQPADTFVLFENANILKIISSQGFHAAINLNHRE